MCPRFAPRIVVNEMLDYIGIEQGYESRRTEVLKHSLHSAFSILGDDFVSTLQC